MSLCNHYVIRIAVYGFNIVLSMAKINNYFGNGALLRGKMLKKI